MKRISDISMIIDKSFYEIATNSKRNGNEIMAQQK